MPDQIFHKRKKREADLKRKNASKQPIKRFLVLAEGERTEPNYLLALRAKFRINPQSLVIHPKKCGMDPRRLVQLAIDEHKKNNDYDHIFCVFDQDSHHHYANALQRIQDLKGKHPIEAVTSVPCFEIWLLLHFIYTTKQYHPKANLSVCDCLICDLKVYIPGYCKGLAEFDAILENTEVAIERALKLKEYCQLNDTQSPSTDVHLLVQSILDLRQR